MDDALKWVVELMPHAIKMLLALRSAFDGDMDEAIRNLDMKTLELEAMRAAHDREIERMPE